MYCKAAASFTTPGWLADCPLGPAPGLPAAVLREQPKQIIKPLCLLKSGPDQFCQAQRSFRANSCSEAGGEEACWGTDCHPPPSPWEAHCGCWSGQDQRNSLLPVCQSPPEVVNCPFLYTPTAHSVEAGYFNLYSPTRSDFSNWILQFCLII